MNQKLWDSLTPVQKFNYLDSKWHKEDQQHNRNVKTKADRLRDRRERTYFDAKTHTFKVAKKL